MIRNFPRYVIYTGAVFVLTVFAFAIYYFAGAPRYATDLQIPLVIRDSATCSSDYTPDLSARYHYELQVYIPTESAYDRDTLYSLDSLFDQIRIDARVYTRSDSIVPHTLFMFNRQASYGSHDSISTMIVVSGESDYLLRSSRLYRCTFAYTSVPKCLWGLQGAVILHERDEDAYEKEYVWFFRSLGFGMFALTAGVTFAVSYLVYWLRSKRSKAKAA